jgi:hypothetical protein
MKLDHKQMRPPSFRPKYGLQTQHQSYSGSHWHQVSHRSLPGTLTHTRLYPLPTNPPFHRQFLGNTPKHQIQALDHNRQRHPKVPMLSNIPSSLPHISRMAHLYAQCSFRLRYARNFFALPPPTRVKTSKPVAYSAGLLSLTRSSCRS